MNEFEKEVIKRLATHNKILKYQNNTLHEENKILKEQMDTLLDVESEEVDMEDYTIIDNPIKKENKEKKVNNYKKAYKGFKKMGSTMSTISTVVKIGKYAALLIL